MLDKKLNELWTKVLEQTIIATNSSGIFKNFNKFTTLTKLENNIAYITSYNSLCLAIYNNDPNIKVHLENAFYEILQENITVIMESIKNIKIENAYIPTIKSELNKNLTFDQFVIGKNNEMPYNILLHASNNLGEHTPIFLYGDPGVGKTHLLSSVGNELLRNHPNSKVLYLSATSFSNRVSDANNNKTIAELKQFFFDLDLLLIDDIQTFKSTHELAQNIFFEIFNELIANRKQIIITSDTTQDKLKNILHGRLTSRFKSGITLIVKSPEVETAKKIVIKKISNNKNNPIFNEEAIDYIANNFNNDIRGLEGAINTILLYAIYNPEKTNTISLDIVLSALNQEEEVVAIETLSPEAIKKFIASKYHITIKQLESKTRTKNILYPRHIAIYLTRILLNLSYENIADIYNKKDHTTIVNSIKRIEQDIIKDIKFKNLIEQFKNELSNVQ